MNIKTELLKGYIANYIIKGIDDFEIDADKICNSLSCEVLEKIQKVIQSDELNDSQAIEKIVEILESYNIDCGSRNDY